MGKNAQLSFPQLVEWFSLLPPPFSNPFTLVTSLQQSHPHLPSAGTMAWAPHRHTPATQLTPSMHSMMQMQILVLSDVSSPDNILINRLPCLETQGMVVKYEFGLVCLRIMEPCKFASHCWFHWCSLVCLVAGGWGWNQSASQNIHKIPKLHYELVLPFKLTLSLKTWILNARILSVIWLSRNTLRHSAHSSLFSLFIPLSHLNLPSAVMWSV